MRRLLVTLVVAGACRGGHRPPAETPIVLPSIEARPADAADLVVAKVDGRPVYGSCVAAQATAHHEDRKQALDDCIGLELLAGAAAARGLAKDPDVALAYRRALVARFVDVEFRQKFARWDDLPASLRDLAFKKYAWRMHRPEYRYAVYVRAPLDDKATPADDAAAHALMQAVYDRLKDRDDLFPVDLYATADELAHGQRVDRSPSPYGTGIAGPGDRTFTEPLFSIASIGRIAPPARTKWGWDVILWVDTMTALETSADDLRAFLFPELRRTYFDQWVEELAKRRQDEIVVDEDRFARLAPADEPPPGAPPKAGAR